MTIADLFKGYDVYNLEELYKKINILLEVFDKSPKDECGVPYELLNLKESILNINEFEQDLLKANLNKEEEKISEYSLELDKKIKEIKNLYSEKFQEHEEFKKELLLTEIDLKTKLELLEKEKRYSDLKSILNEYNN